MAGPIAIGDMIALAQVAWKVYKRIKNAPAEFQAARKELHITASSLDGVIGEQEERLRNLNDSQQNQLRLLVRKFKKHLIELGHFINKYKASMARKWSWARLWFPADELNGIRTDLTTAMNRLEFFFIARIYATTTSIDTTATSIATKLDEALALAATKIRSVRRYVDLCGYEVCQKQVDRTEFLSDNDVPGPQSAPPRQKQKKATIPRAEQPANENPNVDKGTKQQKKKPPQPSRQRFGSAEDSGNKGKGSTKKPVRDPSSQKPLKVNGKESSQRVHSRATQRRRGSSNPPSPEKQAPSSFSSPKNVEKNDGPKRVTSDKGHRKPESKQLAIPEPKHNARGCWK